MAIISRNLCFFETFLYYYRIIIVSVSSQNQIGDDGEKLNKMINKPMIRALSVISQNVPNETLRMTDTEESLFFIVSATAANRKWCLKRNKSLRRTAKGSTFFVFDNNSEWETGPEKRSTIATIGQKVLQRICRLRTAI